MTHLSALQWVGRIAKWAFIVIAWLGWILIGTLYLYCIIGCGRSIETQPRPVSVSPGQPIVETVSTDSPQCWQSNPHQADAYQRCSTSYCPSGYTGDGAHLVTIETDDPGIIHVWPATACGDSMAARANDGPCWICVHDRVSESEMTQRAYSFYATIPPPGPWSAWVDTTIGGYAYQYKQRILPRWREGGLTVQYATFHARAGLGYWCWQHGHEAVRIGANSDTVEVR